MLKIVFRKCNSCVLKIAIHKCNVNKLRRPALPQKKTIIHRFKGTGADRRESEISVPKGLRNS